jgi:hypothetical protein
MDTPADRMEVASGPLDGLAPVNGAPHWAQNRLFGEFSEPHAVQNTTFNALSEKARSSAAE